MKRHILFLFAALLLVCVGCQTQTMIINGIPEREANEIIVLLASKGIEAEKTAAASGVGGGTGDQMWNVSVNSSQITEALAILNQAGLPRAKGKSLLDLFGSQGLVPSEMQDKIRYQEGLSEQLAMTIRKMDGILDANVQITFPQDDEDQKEQLTASVYVKHRGILDNPNSLTITKIKRLIASAVPGLTPDNVSVVTDRALYADISLDPLQQFEDERSFVSVWSIAIAKDSVTRFRLIFYAFIILIFLLVCALGWIIWKCLPVINNRGGVRSLFDATQYDPSEEKKEEETGEE